MKPLLEHGLEVLVEVEVDLLVKWIWVPSTFPSL